MPELPEVETVTSQIRPKLIGKKFTSVKFSDKNLRYNIPKERFDAVLNSEIIKIIRRAKYIQMFFANDQVLILHLGMSGNLLISGSGVAAAKHDHITALFANDNQLMHFVFNDPRRFGMFDVVHKDDLLSSRYFKDLGFEALSSEFSAEFLLALCKKSNTNIKTVIMNQNNVVGVGNIYALESLFYSKIHPLANANKLSKKQCMLLVDNIKKVLRVAIEKGGSSIRDYKQVDGSAAYFQHEFSVYGKEGEDCKICSAKIERIIQNNRSSFLCPKCQG